MWWLCLIAWANPVSTPEPSVTWYFSSQSRADCVTRQLDLMGSFYRAQDRIFLLVPSFREKDVAAVEESIRSQFPGIAIVRIPNPREGAMTGWAWADPITGESTIYQTLTASYSSSKSKNLLASLRAPSGAP